VQVSDKPNVKIRSPGMLSRHPDKDGRGKWIFQCSIDTLAIVFQVSGLFMWPLLIETNGRGWMLPVSAILISCGWWENFVDSSSPYGISDFQ